MADPVVRRAFGAVMFVAAIGLLIVCTVIVSGEPSSSIWRVLLIGVAAGLGAGGLNLLFWPMGHRPR